MCVCSLRYPTCNAHAPYYHLSCQALQHFSTLRHERQDLKKKSCFEHKKCVLVFSTAFETLVSEILSQQYIGLRVKYPSFFSDFNESYSDLKFHENPSSWSRVFQATRWTDGRTDITKLTVAVSDFRTRLNTANIYIYIYIYIYMHYATNRQVAGSIPDGVIGIFQ